MSLKRIGDGNISEVAPQQYHIEVVNSLIKKIYKKVEEIKRTCVHSKNLDFVSFKKKLFQIKQISAKNLL